MLETQPRRYRDSAPQAGWRLPFIPLDAPCEVVHQAPVLVLHLQPRRVASVSRRKWWPGKQARLELEWILL